MKLAILRMPKKEIKERTLSESQKINDINNQESINTKGANMKIKQKKKKKISMKTFFLRHKSIKTENNIKSKEKIA